MEADEASGRLAPRKFEAPWAQRGRDLTRTLALSDGIFAFAMTLLVLGLVLPAGFHPSSEGTVLANLLGSFLAYVLSFFVIWFYWLGHTQLFSYITSFDRRLQQPNVTFLLFIAVMPFVTNLLAAANGVFLTVAIYAFVQIAAGASLGLLWRHAAYPRRHVSAELPAPWVRYVSIRSAIGPLVFAASIPIAYVSVPLGEFSWSALFILQAVFRFSQPVE
ncbi:MAG TPA: TMEM175 family protein [Thermoplasmata archaeon]|nr:TMEM175 family protein [Thermoplasmata archaeon]